MNIVKPTLLIDKEKCITNIKRMADKARKNNLIFRPHFKTHQSNLVAEWFREEGVDKITVSSVSMAKHFINYGWSDITIAFPFNILETDEINNIHTDISINLLIEAEEVFTFLNENLKRKVNFFIKIDVGYNRTGLSNLQYDKISDIVKQSSKSDVLNFKGLLAHFGNTYNVYNREAVERIYYQSIEDILNIKNKLEEVTNDIIISIGDTPTCSIIDDFEGVDEIRPGNFVFYDTMQFNIGTCEFENIAVAVACPVVAKHRDRIEIVIYGGAVHLSKDFILDKKSNKNFGLVVLLNDLKWDNHLNNTYLKSVSQEHGIIAIDKKYFDNISIGDVIGIIPVHSCLTANLLREQLIV